MTARRSALGRGLGALIPSRDGTQPGEPREDAPAPRRSEQRPDAPPSRPDTADAAAAGAEAAPGGEARLELPVDRIVPNPEQPRRHFDAAQLERLASSILRHGVLQPVVVRRAGDRYELIVGERRWRASRAAGLETIPAVVADVAPQERLELAIVENVQRHDLNPIELAHAYRALADAGATQEEIGRKVSMDRSSIANHLRLLELSRSLQEDVESGQLSMGHAKALLQVADPAARQTLRDRVVAEGLSVRATERLGRQLAGPAKAGRRTESAERVDPDLARVLDSLQRRYQTRIQMKGSARKGRLEIDYYDEADLQRILSLLLGETP
jgi:ParB family chromosome partitioning protein